MPTQEDYAKVVELAREYTKASRGTPRDWSGYSDPANYDSQGHYTGPSGVVIHPKLKEALDVGGWDQLLDQEAKKLGIDIATDPVFWRHTEATGGDQAVDLGVGNTLYPNKSGWESPVYEGAYTQGSPQSVGSLMYEKADTDAFKDKVGPGLGSLLAIAGAATGNPLLSMVGEGVSGGGIKDIATAGLGMFGQAGQVTSGAKQALAAAKEFKEQEWDPDNEPRWQDVYEEVLYNGDVLFKDTTTTGGGGDDSTTTGGVPDVTIPDDKDPNEPPKNDMPSFMQLFLDLKGKLGDQEAYSQAEGLPITQGMLASNGYAERDKLELYPLQPFKKTERMGDFLYDMEI